MTAVTATSTSMIGITWNSVDSQTAITRIGCSWRRTRIDGDETGNHIIERHAFSHLCPLFILCQSELCIPCFIIICSPFIISLGLCYTRLGLRLFHTVVHQIRLLWYYINAFYMPKSSRPFHLLDTSMQLLADPAVNILICLESTASINNIIRYIPK